MLTGYWSGGKATEMTKFLDLEFSANGNGKREGEVFKWILEEKGSSKRLKVSWVQALSQNDYNRILSAAESMQSVSSNVKIYQTDGKAFKILMENGKFFEVLTEDVFTVTELTESSLKLSFKNKSGKTIKTSHTKD